MHIKESIMDIITEHAMNERLDAILAQDKVFVGLQEKIDHLIEEFNRLNLTDEQRTIVDDMISAYAESGAYYSAAAYKQGFKDCANFAVEIFDDKADHIQGEKWDADGR